jgi:hypothetical protein
MTTKNGLTLPADWTLAQDRIGLNCRRKDSPVIGCVIATILSLVQRPEGEIRYVIAWPGPVGTAVYTDEAEEDLIFLPRIGARGMRTQPRRRP